MDYFDMLLSGSFKSTKSGATLFYPYGTLGKGYVIKPESQVKLLKRRVLRWYIVMFISIMLVRQAPLQFMIFIYFPVLFIWYHLMITKMVKGLSVSEERYTADEIRTASAKALKWPTLIIFELFSLGFVAASIWIIYSKPEKAGVGLLGIAFFALCAIIFGNMIRKKRRP